MTSTLKSLRALSDPTRLRIVALLEKDEVSVNELQEITRLGQSRISKPLKPLGRRTDRELMRKRARAERACLGKCWRSGLPALRGKPDIALGNSELIVAFCLAKARTRRRG